MRRSQWDYNHSPVRSPKSSFPAAFDLFPYRNLLGELICLVVSLVPVLSLTSSLLDIIGGLLGGSGGLVSGLLNTVLTLVLGLIAPILSSILGALGPVISSCGLGDLLGIFGCQGSYPTACGGTLDILQFATSLLGTLLPLLLGAL